MTNAITKAKNELDRTFDGKRIRTSKEQLSRALAPMFTAFPGLEMSAQTFNTYHMMLCDLDPNRLAVAIVQACQAHKFPTQLVTVAAIRECYEQDSAPPGPRSDVDPATLPPIPSKMFRLDPEEDRRQRMELLRQTRGWDKYYA
jgi:hypothetical protein